MPGPWTLTSYPWVTSLVHVQTIVLIRAMCISIVSYCCSILWSQFAFSCPVASSTQLSPSPLAQYFKSRPTYPIPGASPGHLQFILPVSPSPCDSRSNPEAHQLCFMLLSHPLDLVTCWDCSHLPSTSGFPLLSPQMAGCTGVCRIKHGFKPQLCSLLYVGVWTLLNIIKPHLYNGRLMTSSRWVI